MRVKGARYETHTLRLGNQRQALGKGLEAGRVDLHVALDDIEGSDERVRKAARQNAADHALAIVGIVVRDGVREASVPLSHGCLSVMGEDSEN